jgi:hypothetical protein
LGAGRFFNIPEQELRLAGQHMLWGSCGQEIFTEHMPEAQDQKELVSVFKTGDLGTITPDGLELRGRLDLQAKIGGATCPLSCGPHPAEQGLRL